MDSDEILINKFLISKKKSSVTIMYRNMRLLFRMKTGILRFFNPKDIDIVYNIKEFTYRKFRGNGNAITLQFYDHHELDALKLCFDENNSQSCANASRMINQIMDEFKSSMPTIKKSTIKSCSLISSKNLPSRPISALPPANSPRTLVLETGSLSRPMVTIRQISDPLAGTPRRPPQGSIQKTRTPLFFRNENSNPSLSPKLSTTSQADSVFQFSPNRNLSGNRMPLSPIKKIANISDGSSTEGFMNLPIEGKEPTTSYGHSQKPLLKIFDSSGSDISVPSDLLSNDYDHRRLPNVGNSCFFNSILQALSVIPSFTSRMRQIFTNVFVLNRKFVSGLKRDHGFEILHILCTTIYKLTRRHSEKSQICENISESDLKRMRELFGMKNRDFRNLDQQDAHEFLILLMEYIDEIVRSASKIVFKGVCQMSIEKVSGGVVNKVLENHSDLWRMNPVRAFKIETMNRVYCEKCRKEDVREEVHNDLDVPLRPDCNLQELFMNIFPCTRQLDFRCGRCETRGCVVTSRKISKFPEALVLNLKRYQLCSDREMKPVKSESVVPVRKYLYASSLAKYQKEFEDCSESMLTENMETADKKLSMSHLDFFGSKDDCCSNSINGIDEMEPLKLLGGAKDNPMLNNSDDIEIIEENIPDRITFKPFVHLDQVVKILQHCVIDITITNLRDHLRKFQIHEIREISKKDEPKTIHRVTGDGNCFYRSISWWLTGNERFHATFRKLNVDCMLENRELFLSVAGPGLDDVIKNASVNNNWSNDVELIAMCTLLNVDIFTYLRGAWRLYKPRKNSVNTTCGLTNPHGAIYLTNNESVHFDPVLSTVSSNKESILKRRMVPSNYEDDDEMPPKTAKPFPSQSAKDDGSSMEKESRKKLERECKRGIKYSDLEETDISVDWDRQPVYRLDSVVCHQGSSPNSGHYVAYTRDSAGWVYCSDETVYSVEETEAFQRASETGYLFFLTRIKKNEDIRI